MGKNILEYGSRQRTILAQIKIGIGKRGKPSIWCQLTKNVGYLCYHSKSIKKVTTTGSLGFFKNLSRFIIRGKMDYFSDQNQDCSACRVSILFFWLSFFLSRSLSLSLSLSRSLSLLLALTKARAFPIPALLLQLLVFPHPHRQEDSVSSDEDDERSLPVTLVFLFFR